MTIAPFYTTLDTHASMHRKTVDLKWIWINKFVVLGTSFNSKLLIIAFASTKREKWLLCINIQSSFVRVSVFITLRRFLHNTRLARGEPTHDCSFFYGFDVEPINNHHISIILSSANNQIQINLWLANFFSCCFIFWWTSKSGKIKIKLKS